MKSLAALVSALAVGGGAAQGGIILLGLFSAILAAGLGVYMTRKRRCSIFSFIISLVALLFSAEVAYVFGLPYDWTYWGAYLPWLPLALAACGFVLTLTGAIADLMSRSTSSDS
jgi:hypothetical protein